MSRGLWFAMNARTRRSLTLLWTALFLFSLALQSVQLATPAPTLAAHNENIFELDGNAIDDPANEPDDDWNSVNHSLDNFFVGAASEAAAVDNTYFTGGGSKDENDVDEWARTTNDIAPDKDEILDAYAAVYEQSGDTWVYFGADRFDGSGDAQIGFWFFQDDIGLSGGDFTGQHTDGDVLILSDFTNGGGVDLICVYEWNPPGTDAISGTDCDEGGGDNLTLVAAGADCDVSDGQFDICAVVNSGVATAPWTFLNKAGQSNFAAGEFYEGGINLSDMFGGNPPCFGTFLAETRSSQETDAQLKDFALGSLDTCVPPDIETHVQQNGQNVGSINKGESVVDVATFSGTNGEVEGTVEFFVCGPGSSRPDCSNGGTKVGDTKTINNESATSDPFTPTALGWYCFRAEYTPAEGSEYLAGEHTNDTTECFRVIPADVQIVKTPNNGSVSAGTDISFTLSWANEGEGSATGVVVTDTLPTGGGLNWSISGSTGTGSVCTLSAADVLTCNIGTIAGNPNFPNAAPVNGTVTLTSATTAASCAEINNTGQITSTNDGTDTDPGQITVLCPDVTVAKTPDGGEVNAGETATFTIVVTNLGPGTATGVTLTDNLPAGYTWTLGGADADDCSINTAPNPDVLSCNFGTLADDETRTITLSAPTTGGNCDVIPNTANVAATNEPGGATGNNSDPGDIDVLCAVIDIEKTADPEGPVNAGDTIGFDIVVSNDGDGTANDVSVTDNLPAGIDWTINPAVEGCSISGPVGAEVLTCTRDSLAGGASFTVHIEGVTDPADCGTVNNTAIVTTSNDGGDSDGDSVDIRCPDVQALKVADASPVNAGDPIGFTVTISNHGTGTAYGATASDTLPAGIDWAIDGPANGWSINAGVLSWGPDDLAAGASFSVHLIGTSDAADCGLVLNTVSVDATNESNDPSITDDNTASDDVTVNCPDLQVVKTAEDDAISAGEVAEFSIVITNIGDGTAYDVSLTDNLPGDVAWHVDAVAFDGVDVADPSAYCTITGSIMSCPDLGDLAPDGEISIDLSGDTDLDDCGSLLNSTTVDASNESNDIQITMNNLDTATIDVDCPELGIDKDADHVDPVLIGNPIGFTITIQNNGEGTAFGVTVSDTLDSDFTWSIESSDPGWTLVGNVLSFSGNLAAGASSSVHVTAPTTIGDGDQCGLVPNTAVLDHASIDPTPADASETVQCPEIEIIKGANDDLVEPNQTVTFLLDVEVVDGPVTDAVITDQLPVGQTYVAGSAQSKVSPAAAFTADEPTVSADGRTLTWEFALLPTADPAVTIMYDVTIDADASTDTQVNVAEICISENQLCDSDDEDVTPQLPDIELIKTAGDAADGDVFETTPGAVTYTYEVTNDGPLPLSDVTVTDDAGTPADTSDDYEADCPQTTLAVGESMTCTFTIDVLADTVNVAVARGVSPEGNPVEDDDDAEVVILEFGLIIDKTNDAPLEPLELPDGTIVDLPTADEGETVTYTLDYDLLGDPVTDGVITDVLPVGVTYVDDSATDSDEFIFQGYDDATRTLLWTAENVTKDGSVTYQATIDEGAAELDQPLVNVATIDSAETEPDDDDSPVFVPTIPAGATATPRITLPPTDTFTSDTPAPSNPGFALMLALLAFAALVLVIGFVTPVPASVRERRR
jgi:uncharacterized repeat protein (TIGR01451 family)